MTAGLAAYFLRLAQLGRLRYDGIIPVINSPQLIKDYMLAKSWSRQQVEGADRDGIWNVVDLSGEACLWNPDGPARVRRGEDGPACLVPLSNLTSSSSATSPSVTASSSSSSSSSSKTPSETLATPLEVRPMVCNNETDYPGHANIHGSSVMTLANEACSDWRDSLWANLNSSSGQLSQDLKDQFSVNYYFLVEWVEGCSTTSFSENVWNPLGKAGLTCEEIMYDDWKNCKSRSSLTTCCTS